MQSTKRQFRTESLQVSLPVRLRANSLIFHASAPSDLIPAFRKVLRQALFMLIQHHYHRLLLQKKTPPRTVIHLWHRENDQANASIGKDKNYACLRR
tara:strand:- start:433 stop:723 length:291 start_codon:yes stop_codon:yes gene_type:complete